MISILVSDPKRPSTPIAGESKRKHNLSPATIQRNRYKRINVSTKATRIPQPTWSSSPRIPSSPPVAVEPSKRSQPGIPENPSPTPLRWQPQINPPDRADDHYNWIRRSTTAKGIYSSPDKIAVPVDTSLDDIPILDPETYPITQRIKFVNQCMKNAGFPRLSDYEKALLTGDFQKSKTGPGSRECELLQYHEWNHGLKVRMANINEYLSIRRYQATWRERLQGLNNEIMKFASNIVQTEFRRFATREDHRVTDTLEGKKQTKGANPDARVPSYLQLESQEVTAEVLTSNLITESKTRFQTKVFCLSLIFSSSGCLYVYRCRICGSYCLCSQPIKLMTTERLTPRIKRDRMTIFKLWR